MTEPGSRVFPPWPTSVAEARNYVSGALGHVPTPLCETAALLVSELATNAVRHGTGDFEVSVRDLPEGGVWVGVSDAGRAYPVLRSPAITDEHGRGLRLVGSLSDRWGVRRRRGESAKTVWFELGGPRPIAG